MRRTILLAESWVPLSARKHLHWQCSTTSASLNRTRFCWPRLVLRPWRYAVEGVCLSEWVFSPSTLPTSMIASWLPTNRVSQKTIPERKP